MNEQNYLNSINLNKESNFPYLIMDIAGDKSVPKPLGFHVMQWHEDFQFIYVVSGSIYIHTLFQIETICKGQAIFINKNVVHEVQGSDDCHYKSILFPEYLIEFYPGGPEKRFVTALAENSQLITRLFSNCNEWHKNVLGLLRSQRIRILLFMNMKFWY